MSNENNCIIVRSGTSNVRTIKRKDGTSMQFNEQSAAIEAGEDFPRPFKFNLEENQKPYPPGRYVLDSASLMVGDFDSLKVGRRISLIRIGDLMPPAKV